MLSEKTLWKLEQLWDNYNSDEKNEFLRVFLCWEDKCKIFIHELMENQSKQQGKDIPFEELKSMTEDAYNFLKSKISIN